MKTKEDYRNDLIHSLHLEINYEKDNYDAGRAEGFYEGYDAGIDYAQRWISVKDELPKEGVKVLAKDDNGFLNVMYRKFDVWRSDVPAGEYINACNQKKLSYTHESPELWRPIEIN